MKQQEGNREHVNFPHHSSIVVHENRSRETYPFHWHTAFEIIMPENGSYLVETTNSAYVLQENQILIIPPGQLHQLSPKGEGSRLILLFHYTRLNSFQEFSTLMGALSQVVLITPQTFPRIWEESRLLMVHMSQEYEKQNPVCEFEILSSLLHLLVLLVREITVFPPCLSHEGNSHHQDYGYRFRDVLKYMAGAYTGQVSLAQAASIAGFSKFHFSRLFKRIMGISFGDYLTGLRLSHAKLLLLDSSLTITQIALQSGFPSPSSFNRMFKQVNHCTPTEFKKLMRQSSF